MVPDTDTEPLQGTQEREHAERSDSVIRRGASVGRYVLLDRLGAGGMGVVYAAWDPELERRVAIKLIADRKQSLHQQLRARLKREAQALAKLDHENVVKVFDVGEAEASLFVAMEYVDGVSLRRWLADAERSGAELLAVFRSAGKGLAAAHAQGIVHRDFKTDNVLVGRDGRVRVLDFGLASLATAREDSRSEDDEADPHDEDDESGESERLEDSNASTVPGSPSSSRERGPDSDADALTMPGAVIGTPAYMAPEQQRGLATDARTDQYTFCAALWEALTGTLPFGRGSLAPARAQAGKLGEFERSDVHPGVEQALRRGLAWDPSQRWPDMLALLDALEPPAPRRRWLVLVPVLAVALGLGVANFASRDDAPIVVADQCDAGSDRIAELWTDAGAELRSRFVAREDPAQQLVAERTWPYLAAELQLWTERWIDVDAELCRRYGSTGPSSLEAGVRQDQVACLDRQLIHFEQLTEVLETLSDAEIPRSFDLLSTLPNPRDCSEVTNRSSAEPVASTSDIDPAQIEDAERELARVKLEYHLARLTTVEPRILAFFEQTKAPGLERQHIHAARFRAQYLIDSDKHEEAIEAMLSGVAAAERHGDPELRLQAMMEMSSVYAGTSDGISSRRWLQLAQALAQDLVLDRRTRATLASAEATTAIVDGRPEDALVAFDRALAATDPVAERFLYFARLQNRAVALSGLDRTPEALEQMRRLDQLMADAIDPNHQRVLQTRYEIALMQAKLGQDAEAQALFLAVADAMEAAAGGPTMYSLGARSHAASLRDRLGDCAEAIAEVEPILAEAREVMPPRSGHFVNALRRRVSMCNHESELAVSYAREVLELVRSIVGEKDYGTAAAYADLALALLAAGEPRLALTEIERALELCEGLDLSKPKQARVVADTRAIAALVRHALGQPGALDEVDSLLAALPEDSPAAKRLRALLPPAPP